MRSGIWHADDFIDIGARLIALPSIALHNFVFKCCKFEVEVEGELNYHIITDVTMNFNHIMMLFPIDWVHYQGLSQKIIIMNLCVLLIHKYRL